MFIVTEYAALNESSTVKYDSHDNIFCRQKDEYDTFFELLYYILLNVMFGRPLGFTWD